MNATQFFGKATLAVTLAGLLVSCEEPRYKEALSPEKALKSFELVEGFEIEAFAAEPLIADPIDLVFDHAGNIFVVEMGDYPYKPEPGKGLGVIRQLKDTDGDGKIDSSWVFAEELPDATSVLPWKGGIIVTAAPNILYLTDTDGDGRADSTEVLFTGFFENNSEAQITSLRFGVDNWIYANNNGQKGSVKFNRRPDAPAVATGGGDFRFRLDKNLFEVESGNGQFGLAVDDWGNRFFTQNTLHIQTAPLPRRYLYRHEFLPSYAAVSNIYAHDDLRVYQISEPPYWRVERTNRRQQAYDEAGTGRVEHMHSHFTGASGGTLYASSLFPESFYGNVFTAEVACNLIHRDVIVPTEKGPFFSARRDASETEREFLATKDTWFRPVNFNVGPDGALYIVDMYRQHIETPVSIPDDLKEDMDFLYGNRHGRIYRVYPEGKRPEMVTPDLRNTPSSELVSLLEKPDQWWRLQAQRLLLERQDKSIIGAVETLLNTHADPRTRLHALYVLEGQDALQAKHVEVALKDAEAQVRRHGVILAERFPELLPALAERVEDASAQTAFQAALSVGQFNNATAVAALAKTVQKYKEDDWFRKAVLSSNTGSTPAILQVLQQQDFFKGTDGGAMAFLSDCSFVIGARGNVTDIRSLVSQFSKADKEAQLAYLNGFTKGVKKAKLSDADRRSVATVLNQQASADADVKKALEAAASAAQEKKEG